MHGRTSTTILLPFLAASLSPLFATPLAANESPGKITELEARIEGLEHAISSEEHRKFIQQVEEAEARLATTTLELAGVRLTLARELFEILALLVALTAGVGTLAAFLIRERVSKAAVRSLNQRRAQIEQELRKVVDERVSFGSALCRAVAYLELAYTWWELYEPAFQGNRPYDEFSNNVRMASRMTMKGLEACAEPTFKLEINRSNLAWRTEAALKNHSVYHRAVEFVSKRDDNDARRSRILEDAQICLELSRDERAALEEEQMWFELRETAAFAKALIGTESDRDEGKAELKRLIQGKWIPGYPFRAPPYEWRLNRWKEHNDKFGLGVQQPEPPPSSNS